MATCVVSYDKIVKTLSGVDLVPSIERAFMAYSRGEVDVPPVGELLLPEANGEMHIKYGHAKGAPVFVVKIATGFYDNERRGLPNFGGMVVVGDAHTGAIRMVLLDGGELTNLRTAAAGAVAAKHLGPRKVEAIGVFGSGLQARLQARALRAVTDCRKLVLWARDSKKAEHCLQDLAAAGFEVELAASPAAVAERANLLVATTASREPYLLRKHVRPGTHITAMGSDTPGKNELEPVLLKGACVVADSISQCLVRGEIHHAIASGALTRDDLVELGAVIANPALGRRDQEQITIADLTGVAVQDIAIAELVEASLERVG